MPVRNLSTYRNNTLNPRLILSFCIREYHGKFVNTGNRNKLGKATFFVSVQSVCTINNIYTIICNDAHPCNANSGFIANRTKDLVVRYLKSISSIL